MGRHYFYDDQQVMGTIDGAIWKVVEPRIDDFWDQDLEDVMNTEGRPNIEAAGGDPIPVPICPQWAPIWPWYAPRFLDCFRHRMVRLPLIPVAKPQLISWDVRLNDPIMRQAFTWVIQMYQLRLRSIDHITLVFPPCDWCGQPTGLNCPPCMDHYICITCQKNIGPYCRRCSPDPYATLE